MTPDNLSLRASQQPARPVTHCPVCDIGTLDYVAHVALPFHQRKAVRAKPPASDALGRLMELWQEPWSEAAFGEAQMLLSHLRAALAAPPPDAIDVDARYALGPVHDLGCTCYPHVSAVAFRSAPDTIDVDVLARAQRYTAMVNVNGAIHFVTDDEGKWVLFSQLDRLRRETTDD